MTFVERPVAAGLLVVAAAVMVVAVLPAVSRSRQKAFQE
jgi:putative tricarboxylic transport membrane protein